MTEDLNRLLEISPAEPKPAPTAPRITLVARFCQVFGWLSLLSAGLCFFPDSPGGSPYVSVHVLLSFFGLILFGALTLVAAIAALLRIRFSARRFGGRRQVFISIGMAVLAIALFTGQVNEWSF